MSNEKTAEDTIVTLYNEIQRLEKELSNADDFIWRLQIHNDKLIEGFKWWTFHVAPCRAGINKYVDCTCGLSEFSNLMDIK